MATEWAYPETADEMTAGHAARDGAKTSGEDWAVFYRGHRGQHGDGSWQDLWSAAPLSVSYESHRGPCIIYTSDGRQYSVVYPLSDQA